MNKETMLEMDYHPTKKELPPFDKVPSCPKCGATTPFISVKYNSWYESSGAASGPGASPTEYLYHECKVCSHVWFTHPRDYVATP